RFIVRCDDDRRNFDALAGEVLLQLQSSHLWHLQIGDEAIRQRFGQRSEKLRPRQIRPRIKRTRAEKARQRFQYCRIVVDYGDRRRRRFRHRVSYSILSWVLSSWPKGQ